MSYRRQLCRVLKGVAKTSTGRHFAKPVPAEAIPGYLDVIQKPMDIGTVVLNLRQGKYASLGKAWRHLASTVDWTGSISIKLN